MKKTLSILLAVVLMFALALPVFAADETTDTVTSVPADTQHTVTATYAAGQNVSGGKVYHVTVAWEIDSTLSYTQGDTTYTWNVDETKYEKGSKADDQWNGSATVKITVTNHSNDAITATPSWEAASGITANCTVPTTAVEIASADEGTKLNGDDQVLTGAPKTGTINGTVETPTAGSITADNATVGTITIEIAAKQ